MFRHVGIKVRAGNEQEGQKYQLIGEFHLRGRIHDEALNLTTRH